MPAVHVVQRCKKENLEALMTDLIDYAWEHIALIEQAAKMLVSRYP